jgi:cation diffusion facilitator family transporter
MTPESSALVDAAGRLRHSHDHGLGVARHEARTRWVVLLTCAMMVGELIVGYATHSLALTADGWHMATHAGALGMAAVAYWFARTRARETAFSFGTGKVHALAGYTSAIVLAVVALWMIGESIRRLIHPEAVDFRQALPVAVLGLLVNLVSAKLLHAGHDHDHPAKDHADHDHPHEHEHEDDHHHDHNLRAAYMHVLADALTSVLAIAALVGGQAFGWTFLDAAMGIVGGVVISRWSYGLCKGAARQLLDVVPVAGVAEQVREALEGDGGTEVTDLHVWDIGPGARACIVSLVSARARTVESYRAAILAAGDFAHVTVEVHEVGGGAP